MPDPKTPEHDQKTPESEAAPALPHRDVDMSGLLMPDEPFPVCGEIAP